MSETMDAAPQGAGESIRESLAAAFEEPAADPMPVEAAAESFPEPAPAEPKPIAAPQSWSAAAKARWAELPADLQNEIAKREGDFTRGIEQKTLEARRQYEPFEQIIGPRRQAWARQFGSPEKGLQALVEISENASRDPHGFVRWFAQNTGLDLAQLAQGQVNQTQAAGGASARPASPQGDLSLVARDLSPIASAQGDPRVAALTQQVNHLHDYLAGQQQARQLQELSELSSSVDAFRADPKHEHFDAVAPDVLALIPVVRRALPAASPQQVLQEAYQRTIWGDPGIRAQLMSRHATETASSQAGRQQQDAAQDALTARRSHAASLSLTGAPPPGSLAGPAAELPSTTLREELERQFGANRV